ncbi:PREDICTED: phosphoribosylformylglycinamidine synthase [Dinoponera quadriceps]|uniref:Phosphoribosylformylglycinamidine synthase n=1 Tax=Dinoponera quadriceps TaxID=609295 RepID=A0A6P3WUP5_DINQU|nr:PREDICTED: phosphoribosylformylglycinamidine synthase [Dinoponera quadriceps]XP_014469380.1 PREDICTED: phosphoribosylformylglycinamidine synthase [Dinoponera quadriceps]XP_014469381.1 PREDICTED: phosphoribosylformylglycinamidine synthase [Dinoponera quadriceps]XP_014469382.1 PREDICTED: phosphoribosylformylglycinamidine synthase [Dinoponera quadriceps]
MNILKFYKAPGLKVGQLKNKLHKILQIETSVIDLQTEFCYYVEIEQPLELEEIQTLKWILSPPFEHKCLRDCSVFDEIEDDSVVIEIGPRLNFSTAFSSNVVSMCKSVKLEKVKRVERSIRYNIKYKKRFNKEMENVIVNVLGDRMTECRYEEPIETFDHGFRPEKWFHVDIMREGRKALEEVNTKLGLAFDDWDLDFYTELFLSKLKRNPTSVECFDLAQSNSEHSRHWFFKGRIILDGEEQQQSLIDMIIDTQNYSNANNVIKFSDNSSAINGFQVAVLRPTKTYDSSNFHLQDIKQHLIFTAETHNFPTGVAPFSGATTGTGGRLRDIEGIGRGGNYIAGTAGYSVGNLHIPGYDLPWEEKNIDYPSNMASPLEIIIEASNGASDYGNKFGEPVICGFARTYGATDNIGVRREWIKPIMFSGGLGTMDANLTNKVPAERGMRVVKIGGPIYRIGVGGGSASSVEVQGDNSSELDFGAVQRGDPEMEQKLNRMVRACVEMGDNNPILSIHDQGAGGNGNVLKELVEPAGAVIFTKCFDLGDLSISTLELWGAEYQESNAILCKPEDSDLLKKIAAREKCPINFVGTVTGNGKIIVSEEEDCNTSKYLNYEGRNACLDIKHPVNLDLELILGKMPRKVFNLQKESPQRSPIRLPDGLTVSSALDRVLRLPSVASKRYLTNKVDRCVTGLVAQQQCVGPLHTPLADVAVTAISHFSVEGIASSIGEQPIKGLVNAAAGARMTVAEAVSNLVFARISSLQDVKCSGNWMWPAKLPGEGAALYEACTAMCSLMRELGIAIDGGKDSLSMAARIGQKIVKAPGTLVVSCYAPCPDIRCVVTPDLKAPVTGRQGCLLFVDLSRGKSRLSGTALSQVYNELGDDVPDVEDARALRNAFDTTQQLIADEKILAGHDVSDGGLITCLLEMCFAGISGINVNISHRSAPAIDVLFSEEVGWVLEIDQVHYDEAIQVFQHQGISVYPIGKSVGFGISSEVIVRVRSEIVLSTTVIDLMKIWEETSYQLERHQMNVDCASEEFIGLEGRTIPAYRLSFNPIRIDPDFAISRTISKSIKVAVIREEGINGDREMAASLLEAGFDVWDVTMQDLLENHVNLEIFRGVIFPGGFSYADVCGSAKGWAASLLFNPSLREQLRQFVNRKDTFSLGVCNGCQLMNLLGWVGNVNTEETAIYLDHNLSERFECRWSTVKIESSPSIMLKAMEGSVLGIWVAHGEGRFTFRDKETLETLERNNCLPLRYTDDSGNPTSRYPQNPNGSVNGIAAVCSKDGRHLAMMPHPERCTRMWQWPWRPTEWNFEVSPWQRLFDNAFIWCQKQD